MITHIRPKILFSQLKLSNEQKLVTVRLPSRRDDSIDDRSASTLETMCLLTLQKIVRPKVTFEFGTCLGATTLNLALNSDTEIFTLDLPPLKAMQTYELKEWDNSDPNISALLNNEREYHGLIDLKQITELVGDSREFDFSPYYSACDFIWIDGGHSYEVVESDTRNALKMIRPGGVIAWHDYGEPLYPGVAQCLDHLSFEMFHVLGTSLVYKIC